jgi:hypothetical protein
MVFSLKAKKCVLSNYAFNLGQLLLKMMKILGFREKYENNRNLVMMTLIQDGKPNYFEWSPFRAFS